jgi:general secretion pathway protein N
VLACGVVGIPAALLLPNGAGAPAGVVDRPSDPAGVLPVIGTDAPAVPSAGAPAVLAPFAALTQTTARPLFAATRRPLPPEPVAESSPAVAVDLPPAPAMPPVERTDFVLVGIVQQADGTFALLKPRAGGPVVTAREGDDAGGWHVEAITPTAVRLTSPAGDAKHVLFAPRQAPDAVAGGPAPLQ